MRKISSSLADKTVLTLRAIGQSDELRDEIIKRGGHVISVPLLSFVEPTGSVKQTTLETLREIDSFDWLVFTSKNGVLFTFQMLQELGLQLSSKTKIAVIGSKTAECLETFGKKADFTPSSFVAEIFVIEFLHMIQPNERVLICKGNLARDMIATALVENDVSITEVIVYDNVRPKNAVSDLVKALRSDTIDIIIFTSPSSVAGFMDIVTNTPLLAYVENCMIVSIGPITTKCIHSYGLSAYMTAEEFTANGIVRVLEKE